MTKSIVPQSEWEWFGDPGHFICGQWCRFHLCTKVGEWLVSTVGAYVHPRHGMGSETKEAEWLMDNWPGEDIGYNRKYETLVFRVTGKCTDEACKCGMPTFDGSETDGEGYGTAGEAAAGHLALCLKYASIVAEPTGA